MTEPATLTAAEVAGRLRHSRRWFRENRDRLEAAGFPPPVPCTHDRLWSRVAVERWIAGDTAADTAAAEIKRREATLLARSKQIAAQMAGKN